MTKTEQNRLLAWRLKLLREASASSRSVARTCRRFGLSRQASYKWRAGHRAFAEGGLCDRHRVPLRCPRARPRKSSPRSSTCGSATTLPQVIHVVEAAI